MKTIKSDLDIDFIGGEEKLTKQEEQALNEYFKNNKRKRKDRVSNAHKATEISVK